MPFGWVAGAIVAGGAIAAIGSNMAADKQANAQKQAAQTQADMFNTITGQEQPFMDAGKADLSRLQDLLGTSGNTKAAGYGSLNKPFTQADYLANQDPGYQFQLKTGAQALRNADTPGVGSLSGAALKDLMGFNQGMAATGYQNAFNRYQTQNNAVFSRLSGIAGLGQNAASNTGTAGVGLGTGIAQAQAAAGASQAAGILGGTSALSNSANSLAGLMFLNGGGSGMAGAGAGAGSAESAALLAGGS